jgi:hypothetical protein
VHRYKIENSNNWLLANLLEGGMISQADASRFLGMKINTIYYAIEHKKINVYHWEGRIYLSFMDVLEYGLRSKICRVEAPIDKRVRDMHRYSYARFSGILEQNKEK